MYSESACQHFNPTVHFALTINDFCISETMHRPYRFRLRLCSVTTVSRYCGCTVLNTASPRSAPWTSSCSGRIQKEVIQHSSLVKTCFYFPLDNSTIIYQVLGNMKFLYFIQVQNWEKVTACSLLIPHVPVNSVLVLEIQRSVLVVIDLGFYSEAPNF